jgi:hypothetical protein
MNPPKMKVEVNQDFSKFQRHLLYTEKILRVKAASRIFGPTRTDDGYWRIKTNQEINNLLNGQNIIGFIKKQRLNWLGHAERMTEDNNVQKIKDGNPCIKNILEDLKHVGNMTFWKIKRA